MTTPTISNFNESKNTLTFTLENVNVSVANALRRIIVSNIPTFAFKTYPHEESNVVIHKNNTRLNNEIIKQRISCIPIHIKNHDIDYSNLECIIDKKNDTDAMVYVTTEDFQIKNTLTNKFLSREEVKKIFPSNKTTKDYILIARLRQKFNDTNPGEHLHFTAKLSLETAKTDGAFNVSHTCFYRNSVDPVLQNKEWSSFEKNLLVNSSEEKEDAKKNWYLHEGLRFTKPNSFDFTVESVGVFTNKELVLKACSIFQEKMKKIFESIQNDGSLIQKSKTTMENSFDITLKNEDYTIGKVIEYLLHDNYYKVDKKDTSKKLLNYVGFRKMHPHDDDSIVRIALTKPIERTGIIDMLYQCYMMSNTMFETMKTLF